MSLATVKLVKNEYLSDFYLTRDPALLAGKMTQDGYYTTLCNVELPGLSGIAAAEEVFDLSNNPSRQKDREIFYGRGRSLSVGDIVNIDGKDFLCASYGWIRI